MPISIQDEFHSVAPCVCDPPEEQWTLKQQYNNVEHYPGIFETVLLYRCQRCGAKMVRVNGDDAFMINTGQIGRDYRITEEGEPHSKF